jgi:phosphoribosyl 1,2-cyclic phosphate phosphodiesterase
MEILFLGTSGGFLIPSFHCDCDVCEAARLTPGERRTRASLLALGKETVLVDAGPDLSFQLERDQILRINRVFLTHWHFDHIQGLSDLLMPASFGGWGAIEIYLPFQVVPRFEKTFDYLKSVVHLNPIKPGDHIELPDATWEVVKTTHTEESVGFIIEASRRLAYLVDGVVPPAETLARLTEIDELVLEATFDEFLPAADERWPNFSVQEAVAFWKQTEIKRCLLTHLSCHSWNRGRLTAGFSAAQRLEFEETHPGLRFANEQARISL